MPSDSLTAEIQNLENKERAILSQKYFKTGPGQYGEGDIFLGIDVPTQRKLSKKYRDLPLNEVEKLLRSPIHEYRLTALFILVLQYQRGDSPLKEQIVDYYLRNLKHVNNWDLVDSSAPHILGDFLLEKDKALLYDLVRSEDLWRKRVAIMATFAFIKCDRFEDALKISKLLLQDKHDLIHKAVGWMLREVGNRNLKAEIEFLDKYYGVMPRTMLRYAIEKFSQGTRANYLSK